MAEEGSAALCCKTHVHADAWGLSYKAAQVLTNFAFVASKHSGPRLEIYGSV